MTSLAWMMFLTILLLAWAPGLGFFLRLCGSSTYQQYVTEDLVRSENIAKKLQRILDVNARLTKLESGKGAAFLTCIVHSANVFVWSLSLVDVFGVGGWVKANVADGSYAVVLLSCYAVTFSISGWTWPEIKQQYRDLRHPRLSGGPVAPEGMRAQTRDSILYIRKAARRRDGAIEEVVDSATGFIISANGHVVTCAHLVSRPGDAGFSDDYVDVRYYASPSPHVNEDWRLEIVHQSSELDVVLMVLLPRKPWKPLPIGRSSNLPDDAQLLVYGFQSGNDLSSNAGLLGNRNGIRGMFQTTLPLTVGNSGSPVFDWGAMDGRVIGIAAGGIDDVAGITYVIPSNHLSNLLSIAGVTFDSEVR